MKKILASNQWKTDPRAAYIPPGLFVSIFLIVCLIVGPAWSFEVVNSHYDQDLVSAQTLSQPSSPTVVDSCLPLLKAIHTSSPVSAMDRNRRSAGKAAALGLVLGVRFALTPPTSAKPNVNKSRAQLWDSAHSASNNRAALAVSAYRQCQKQQALQALSEFRWAR